MTKSLEKGCKKLEQAYKKASNALSEEERLEFRREMLALIADGEFVLLNGYIAPMKSSRKKGII